MNYKVLYSNKNFLKNYNEEIPETWDELIIIAKKILEKENNNLIGYNGFFPGRNNYNYLDIN